MGCQKLQTIDKLGKKLNNVQQLSQDDIDFQKEEIVYSGFFKFKRYTFRHKLHAGGWSKPIKREIFERGNAVAVLPFDPELQEFVFIEQFRVATMHDCDKPWLLEVVAGIMEPGETPEQVCRREAQEEAGVDILALTHIIDFYPSPGACTEKLGLFFATVDGSNAGGIHGLETENEDILVHRVPANTALQWLDEGRINNSATIIALQWFALHRDKFKAQKTTR